MRRALTLFVSLALAGGAAVAAPAVASAQGRAVIPQSHPDWATPQAKVAETTPSSKLNFRVYLAMRDQAGAQSVAQAVSDPSSKTYRQYLTPAQVTDRFAATDATVKSVRDWLAGSGFSIGDVPSNKAYVEASGTADQVEKAFSVDLAKYKVDGQVLRAADKELSVPAALSGQVLGVVGVDQATQLLKPQHTDGTPNDVPPSDGFRNAPPCSTYYGEKVDTTDPAYGGKNLPYAPCGYTPAQLRSAYGVDKVPADGKGTTVAIVDAFASPTLYADAAEYARRNDPAHPLLTSQFSEKVFPATPGQEAPDQCDAAGWYGEQTLDVEAVHGLAPGANILYVGGADCQDASLDSALNWIVAGHRADIISNSYGDTGEDIPASEVKVWTQIAVQAALEGIGVFFSSGDNGDEAARLGHPAADFPASDSWVTAVGGTSLAVGKDGRKLFETGWETGKSVLTNGAYVPGPPGAYTSGSGGGTSVLFDQPFYQKGIVPDALSTQNQHGNHKGRVVPDISAVGDPNTGFLVGQTQTFPEGVHYDQYRIGGTSLASPVLAGIVAVSDSLSHFHHGFLNPLAYQVASRTPAISDVKHVDGAVERVDYANSVDASDGLITSARTFDYPNLTIHTTSGYDNVTGLGSPNGLAFLLLP
ncbi:subtilase family serine protease [Amycolatopsis bartoniae]|uniref:Serine protease n=1 Tax=Amycolatopsis bartoniae TaxID=941986 RepID=A0A8H9MAH4_9PSEU|nr:S53 family peptidase [Amycolatopsis bartoniae]MBB2934255.1 subtilase family serine protease [Amycolatopsis bartoniae]TVT08460.1 S8/S53 family peptidase [Amycolatopsis bartoniae]GHF48741.1 serine protease [Amycolatopsis bartoniae]